MKIEIRNYKSVETNPCANPCLSNDGGGYSQPTITGVFNDGARFVIEDTSCGSFGRRIYVEVSSSRGKFVAYFGEMLEDVEQYTTFSRQNRYAERYAEAIVNLFGYYYRVPRVEELEEEEFFEDEEDEEYLA